MTRFLIPIFGGALALVCVGALAFPMFAPSVDYKFAQAAKPGEITYRCQIDGTAEQTMVNALAAHEFLEPALDATSAWQGKQAGVALDGTLTAQGQIAALESIAAQAQEKRREILNRMDAKFHCKMLDHPNYS